MEYLSLSIKCMIFRGGGVKEIQNEFDYLSNGINKKVYENKIYFIKDGDVKKQYTWRAWNDTRSGTTKTYYAPYKENNYLRFRVYSSTGYQLGWYIVPTINSNVNMVHIKARFIINNQSCATFWTFRNSVYDHETWSSNQVNIEADVEVTNMNSIYFWEYPSASRYNANFYLDIFEMYFYKK